jgi:mannitol/fructose-specific phosphotransferase system IIA component (Ntr-type)|tara:strand:+ start:236 stop:400 length:165 start_codon:yes stop_codon:yes gene_type:complete
MEKKRDPKLSFLLSLLSNEDEKIILEMVYKKLDHKDIVESLINYKTAELKEPQK